MLFIPEDDPDTAEKEDQSGIEIVDTIEWDGVGDESPVEEIDPDSLKPGEDGRYELVDMDLDVHQPGKLAGRTPIVDPIQGIIGYDYTLPS